MAEEIEPIRNEINKPKEKRIKLFLKNYWKYILGIFVTLGLIGFLIWKSNPIEVWNGFTNSRIEYIFAALGCTFLLFVLKTIRWQLILKPHGYNIPFFEALKLITIGTFGSAITPAKVGDVLRAFYLSKNKKEVKVGVSVFSVIFDRILDLSSIFVLLIFTAPITLFFFGFDMIEWWILASIVGGFVIFVILIFISFNGKLSKPILNFFIKYLSKMFKKDEVKNKINISSKEIIDDFYDNQRNYKFWNYLILGFISFSFWSILGIQGFLLLLAFNASITFSSLIIIITIMAVLSIAAISSMAIPISLGGIGIRDTVIMGLFLIFLNIEKATSINLSIFQTFLNVLIPGIIGGIILIGINRKIPNKIETKSPS
ncbi:MAG TPA: lysylphosphatidylglycerol synthase transmembrane domain-containing protein [candidate division Zixibacteria bacterium]|nr:lysylphosphatidylglycerol synthase transmembrane domain-containing protein [candidate division Zixibacteria bacterium]